MVAMVNHTTVDGMKLIDLVKGGKLKKEQLDKIIDRTKDEEQK